MRPSLMVLVRPQVANRERNPMRYICISIVATLMLAGTSFGATINVPGDYVTIQEAVDAASDGDEIIVAAGTYTSAGYNVVDLGSKNVVLRSSAGPASTVINCEASRRGILCNGGQNNSTLIEGFSIIGGLADVGGGGAPGSEGHPEHPEYGGGGSGIYCNNSNPVIRNCTITNCTGWSGAAIYCYQNANPTIEQCRFIANTTYFDGAVAMRFSSPSILDCMFLRNVGANGAGLMSSDSSHPTVHRSTFAGNHAVSLNDVHWGNGGAAYAWAATIGLFDCVVYDNKADDGAGSFWANNASSITAHRTTICDNSSEPVGNVSLIDCHQCDQCAGDTDGNGVVDIEDLLNMMGSWGACP